MHTWFPLAKYFQNIQTWHCMISSSTIFGWISHKTWEMREAGSRQGEPWRLWWGVSSPLEESVHVRFGFWCKTGVEEAFQCLQASCEKWKCWAKWKMKILTRCTSKNSRASWGYQLARSVSCWVALRDLDRGGGWKPGKWRRGKDRKRDKRKRDNSFRIMFWNLCRPGRTLPRWWLAPNESGEHQRVLQRSTDNQDDYFIWF